MNDKEVIDLSDEFTFEFEDDDSKYNEEISNLVDENTKLRENIDELYSEIMKLLTGLKKTPEKSTIKWPNRLQDIEKFEDKLNKIYTTVK